MQKSIIAYVLIFIFLIGFVFVTYYHPSGSGTTTTIPATTIPQNATTTTIFDNFSTSTTTIPATSCLSSQPSVAIANGDFGTGNYTDWNMTGFGFDAPGPVNLTYANSPSVRGYYNHTWTGYDGTFFASTSHYSAIGVQPGNLTSNPFLATEPYLNFKIISPQNELLYVEVLVNNVTKISTHYNTYVQGNPYPTSQFLNASIPLSSLLCQNVSVRLVAQVVGSFTTSRTYIAAGDFYLSKTPAVNPGITSSIIVNQTIKGVNG